MGEDDYDGDAMAKRNEEHGRAYEALWKSARGKDIAEVEHSLREFTRTYAPYAEEVDVVMQSRVMSDPLWGLKHPWSAVAIAWRFRKARSPRHTLSFFLRPRFTG
jgi:hypothetical protein